MDYETLEDRYSDKLERQEACEQAHEAQATAEIRAAWAAFFAGTGTRVPALRIRSDRTLEEVNEPATEAMHDIGIRTDEPDHIEQARKDFIFLRSVRETFSSAAGKIGSTILLAVVGGFLWAVWWGIQFAVTAKTGAPAR